MGCTKWGMFSGLVVVVVVVVACMVSFGVALTDPRDGTFFFLFSLLFCF